MYLPRFQRQWKKRVEKRKRDLFPFFSLREIENRRRWQGKKGGPRKRHKNARVGHSASMSQQHQCKGIIIPLCSHCSRRRCRCSFNFSRTNRETQPPSTHHPSSGEATNNSNEVQNSKRRNDWTAQREGERQTFPLTLLTTMNARRAGVAEEETDFSGKVIDNSIALALRNPAALGLPAKSL